MSMKRVRALMKEAHEGFLATTDGKRPAVRPMSAWAWFGKELWIATGTKSAKAADIRKRPGVEVCYMTKDYRHVRVAGSCTSSDAPEVKKRMFGAFPWMKDHFGSPASPGWTVLRVKPKSIRLMDTKEMRYREVVNPAK